ncbi:MAG TPA: ATPase, partial [Planctomycetes bacterium]|nr:ATPase [Planctomycetota bacterium]
VALAFEAGEPGAMKRPPRRPTEGMFNPLMTQQVLLSGLTMAAICFGAWYWLLDLGISEEAARNRLLLLMVLCQNIHVFNVRSEYTSAFRMPISRNYILFFGVLAAQGLHLLCMHLPLMQEVLGIAPTSLRQWSALLGIAMAMLAVMELFKLLRARFAARPGTSPGDD